MDKRISELRERLYKKKAEARQKENLPVRLRPHGSHLHKILFVTILRFLFLWIQCQVGQSEIKCKNNLLKMFFLLLKWPFRYGLINIENLPCSWREPTVHRLPSQLPALWAASPQLDRTFKCPYLANRKEATMSPLSPWSLRLWVWITRPTTVAQSQVCRNYDVKLAARCASYYK